MNPGPNTLGQLGLSNYGVLVNPSVSGYKAGGITIDPTALTALASPVTYPGGTNTQSIPAGEKYIPAGTIMFRQSSNGKYRPALAADALVSGECYVTDRAWIASLHSEQFGEVFDAGTVIQSRLLVGGAAKSLADFKVAFPRVGFYKD